MLCFLKIRFLIFGFLQGFGIHPWKAPGVKNGWEKRLEENLKKFPQSFCGEFGLGIAFLSVSNLFFKKTNIVAFFRQLHNYRTHSTKILKS